MEKLIAAAEESEGDANVNAKDSKWLTPLHRACRQSNEVRMYKLYVTDSSFNLNLRITLKAYIRSDDCKRSKEMAQMTTS